MGTNQEVEIRNNCNTIIGWCRDFGDVIQAISLRKGFVGRYSKSANITFDEHGQIYCYGDATPELVRRADR